MWLGVRRLCFLNYGLGAAGGWLLLLFARAIANSTTTHVDSVARPCIHMKNCKFMYVADAVRNYWWVQPDFRVRARGAHWPSQVSLFQRKLDRAVLFPACFPGNAVICLNKLWVSRPLPPRLY